MNGEIEETDVNVESVHTMTWRDRLARGFQNHLDRSAHHLFRRWLVTLGLVMVYTLRVYWVKGFHVVSYGLATYVLNLLMGFLSPKVDPELEGIDGIPSPGRESDEYKPFERRLPEFRLWYSITKAFIVSLIMTFVSVLDVPVFWPILSSYWVVLFVLTMKRQIVHMFKYKYNPFSKGKPAAGMNRLFQSAQTGDVEEFHTLLKEQPLILHQIPITCTDNPLHFSCALGHLDFTKVVLQLKPEFAGELNSEGYSPLHIACSNGQIPTVKEIIRVDSSICHLQGRDGNTPLHVAVLRGKVDVICEMLEKCEGCLDDLTFQRETAMHLAVKSIQFGSFRVMLDWIRRNNLGAILNMKDEHGNTLLHLAIWKKQRQVLDLLLENDFGTLEVNAINNSNLTALDLLSIFPSEAGDREIQEILQGAGAIKAQNLPLQITTNSCGTRYTPLDNSSSYNLIQYFKFHAGRDSPSDVRSTLLVIAVLAATATYQLGISPPGGTWQDDQGHTAGTSILGTHKLVSYVLLVAFNSLGFNISLYMIAILTSKFPLAIDLRLLLFCLYFTYNLTVGASSPENAQFFVIGVTSILPTAVPLIGNLLRKFEVFRRVLGLFRRGR